MSRSRSIVLISISLVALLSSACRPSGAERTAAPASDPPSPGATRGPSGGMGAPTSQGPISDASARSEGSRVDLADPVFSDPTAITNPLFPIEEVTQVLQLGAEGSAMLRQEVTLLPETRMIDWGGQSIEAVTSQFIAYSDGRILEVAVDYFAQADDGSVWYLGEDVDNYKRGVIHDHDGSWLAGREGPGGMIMPAHPQVGDVYRPENIPGVVFEEVTVQAIDLTVDGPSSAIDGAVLVQEAPMDGDLEDKTFAPGYGEFIASVPASDELVTAALGVPTDSLPTAVPVSLSTMSDGSAAVFEAVGRAGWSDISATVDSLTVAWETYRADGVPGLVAAETSAALDELTAAVGARDPVRTCQAALDVAQATLDLRLRHETPAMIDTKRLDIWARQILIDTTGEDAHAVRGDVAVLETIGDRVSSTWDAATVAAVDSLLVELRAAADAGDLRAAREAAQGLMTALARV